MHLLLLLVLMGSLFAQDVAAENEVNLALPRYFLGCKEPKQGPAGHRGPPGPPGVAFLPSFLSVYTTDSCQSATGCTGIVPHTAVVFEKLAIPVQGPAMSYNNTTGTVTFNATGFFEVTYGMIIDPLPNAGLAIQMNPAGIYSGTPGFASGSGLVPGSEIDISTQDRLARVSVIINVTEINQTLQLVSGNTPDSTGANNISMDTQGGGTLLNPILAFLTIKQLK